MCVLAKMITPGSDSLAPYLTGSAVEQVTFHIGRIFTNQCNCSHCWQVDSPQNNHSHSCPECWGIRLHSNRYCLHIHRYLQWNRKFNPNGPQCSSLSDVILMTTWIFKVEDNDTNSLRGVSILTSAIAAIIGEFVAFPTITVIAAHIVGTFVFTAICVYVTFINICKDKNWSDF